MLPESVHRARSEYVIGNRIILPVSFTDSTTGDPADPDDLTLELSPHIGDVESYTYGVDAEIVKDDPGEYHAILEPDAEGVFHWYWSGTGGGVTAAARGQFRILAAFP